MTEIESIINDNNKLKLFVKDFVNSLPNVIDKNIVDQTMNKINRKYKMYPTKNDIRNLILKEYDINIQNKLVNYLIKKSMRSNSGVLVVTVVLKPDQFSCTKKCAYCPTETDLNGNPTQPKSYLSTEPAMLRALANNFDIKNQILDRINCYIKTGNIILDNNIENSYKIEVIVSGGTWDIYKYDYRESVINEIFYGLNTFNNNREIFSLEKEITINETAMFRCIGLTIETRPDFINKYNIINYRRWGVTRVQIGVQHYNDNILYKIKRECYLKDTIRAILLLKQCGFKIVCHLMPDLPTSSPVMDKWMFNEAINNPDLQFDDVKIYPTAVCKSSDPNLIITSEISKWYESKEYIPYAEKNINDLINVLIYYKTNIQPWVRIQRLVRDIPTQSILAGYNKFTNLRQFIQDKMNKEHLQCNCIRCKEIKDDKCTTTPYLVVNKYLASNGIEYFISLQQHSPSIYNYLTNILINFINIFVTNKFYWNGNLKTYNKILGFCRLRLDENSGGNIIKEIKDCALIREVHVYGKTQNINNKSNFFNKTQHLGYGKYLINIAEQISKNNFYNKVAVISGIGSRKYYENKCGYNLFGTYMIKKI
jgi:ELP3 family radical SAM enzyme/protein acetyltransferase